MFVVGSDEFLDSWQLLHHALMRPQSRVGVQDAATADSLSIGGPLEKDEVDKRKSVSAHVRVGAQNLNSFGEALRNSSSNRLLVV